MERANPGPHARFLNTGAAPAAWNMAVDELLFGRCRERLRENAPPAQIPLVFRVYAWSPPAISLGRGQAAERDIHVERLAEEGIEICRRLTGGRAVLHDCELTYSVTGPEAVLGESIEKTYRAISAGLAAGLAALGAPVALTPPNGSAYASQGSCFATASVWEIAVGGRKMVGSAQCREGGAVLQHGSVLLRSSEARLASLLKSRGAGRITQTPAHAVGLWEVLGAEVAFDEVADALRRGLAGALNLRFEERALSSEERAAASGLARGRYADSAWTLAR